MLSSIKSVVIGQQSKARRLQLLGRLAEMHSWIRFRTVAPEARPILHNRWLFAKPEQAAARAK
jgi:hypothetical protein